MIYLYPRGIPPPQAHRNDNEEIEDPEENVKDSGEEEVREELDSQDDVDDDQDYHEDPLENEDEVKTHEIDGVEEKVEEALISLVQT